jgi:hypothetical protein
MDETASGSQTEVSFPGIAFTVGEDWEKRFSLLRLTSAGTLLRLRKSLLENIDQLSPPLVLPVAVSHVVLHGDVREIPQPLVGNLEREGGEFVLEIPEIGIFATGETMSDTQTDLFAQIEALVDKFGPLQESQMTPSGTALKAKLQALSLL